MIVLTAQKADAPRRTDQGAKMWCCPSYVGGTPVPLRPGGCAGCSKIDSHNVTENLVIDVPHGEHRYGMIPVEERQDAENLHRMGSALFLWSYVLWGYIGNDILYNAGPGADNASQAWRYEVVAVDVGYMQLKGPNPKLLTTGASRVNPDWPGPDPITGTYGRLVFTDSVAAMVPCAAAVEFLYPSVLWGKAYPLITSIGPPSSDAPDGVTFDVFFADGFDARMAVVPYDAAYPPTDGKYYVGVRFEALAPQQYKDFQEPKEVQFSPVSATYTSPGTYDLKDADGDDTRVLFPWMATGAFAAVFDPPQTVAMASRLLTVKTGTGTGYKTTLDVSDLTFTSLAIDYWAESTATDETRVPVMGQCRHSKLDPTGSYVHAGGPQHCSRVASSGFAIGDYHQACWLPSCSEFSLDDESPGTVGDHGHLSSLWTRAGWVLIQGVPGNSSSRNFTLAQTGGASVAGFLGSFCDRVPQGYFADRVEWNIRALGKRFDYVDEHDDGRQALSFGAFYKTAHAFGDGYHPDAFGTLSLGHLPNNVTGYVDGKEIAAYPWRYTGHTHVYGFGHGNSSLARVNTPTESESYLTAVDVNAVAEPALVARLRAIY